jgi:hypothetical protein
VITILNTDKNSVDRMKSFCKQVLHIVTTGFYRANDAVTTLQSLCQMRSNMTVAGFELTQYEAMWHTLRYKLDVY